MLKVPTTKRYFFRGGFNKREYMCILTNVSRILFLGKLLGENFGPGPRICVVVIRGKCLVIYK